MLSRLQLIANPRKIIFLGLGSSEKSLKIGVINDPLS